MMQQFLIIIVLLLLIGAAAVTLLLDARQRRIDRQVAIALSTSHSESAALHSSVTGRVPVAVSPSPGQLQGRDSLRLAPRSMCCLPAPSQRRQSSMLIACWDFPPSTCLSRLSLWPSWWCEVCLDGSTRRLANQLFRQLPDTIELVTSAVRSGLPVNEAFRTISREMPQPTAGQFAIVCSELSSGETSGGSCRSRLSANASGGVWIFCGDACSPDEVRWRFDRNLADTGRHRASACCAGCSREGSGRRGDLFLASTFSVALHCRWVTILDQSANS